VSELPLNVIPALLQLGSLANSAVLGGGAGDEANATDPADTPARPRTQSNAASGYRLALLAVLFANLVT
jgi:hypothetical protein